MKKKMGTNICASVYILAAHQEPTHCKLAALQPEKEEVIDILYSFRIRNMIQYLFVSQN